MIHNQIKSQFAAAEPVTREFVALMDATFRPYTDLRAYFFTALPQHLHQSELVSLVNVELKGRLFEQGFCEGIPEALKSLRRAIIRLEDLRAAEPHLAPEVNDLARLAALAERVEALYQKHWEHYRYQDRLSEQDLVDFMLEIDQIAYDWDLYLRTFSALHAVVQELTGQPCPDGMAPLRVAYQREAPAHFAVGTLKALMDFFEAGYRFVCAASETDADAQPLSLLQVEMAEPVELHLAVPEAVAPAYRRFLQYLFLQDMLKRDALLKVVFEAVSKELGRDKALPAPTVNTHHKELTSALSRLPADGHFTVVDRTFPDDRVRVLQEFTARLDENQIRYDALLRSGDSKPRSRKGGKAKAGETGEVAAAPGNGQAPAAEGGAPAAQGGGADGNSQQDLTRYVQNKEHLQVLTEKERSGSSS